MRTHPPYLDRPLPRCTHPDIVYYTPGTPTNSDPGLYSISIYKFPQPVQKEPVVPTADEQLYRVQLYPPTSPCIIPNFHKEHSTNPHQPYPSLPPAQPLHYPSYPEKICICPLHTVALDGGLERVIKTPEWALTGSCRAQERVIRLQWVGI